MNSVPLDTHILTTKSGTHRRRRAGRVRHQRLDPIASTAMGVEDIENQIPQKERTECLGRPEQNCKGPGTHNGGKEGSTSLCNMRELAGI